MSLHDALRIPIEFLLSADELALPGEASLDGPARHCPRSEEQWRQRDFLCDYPERIVIHSACGIDLVWRAFGTGNS